jgi:hypothetical protein
MVDLQFKNEDNNIPVIMDYNDLQFKNKNNNVPVIITFWFL